MEIEDDDDVSISKQREIYSIAIIRRSLGQIDATVLLVIVCGSHDGGDKEMRSGADDDSWWGGNNSIICHATSTTKRNLKSSVSNYSFLPCFLPTVLKEGESSCRLKQVHTVVIWIHFVRS